MKKIVALVLSLAMALSLATAAFAVVPTWAAANGGVNNVDTYAMSNQKYGTDVMTYHAAKAPTAGVAGNIEYYTFLSDNNTKTYTMSTKYSADASFAVKAADASVPSGAQSDPEALYFMTEVTNVKYIYEASVYTAWGNLCEQYKKPADADSVTYVQYTQKFDAGTPTVVVALNKASVATTANGLDSVLVNGVVYVIAGSPLTAVKHSWVANTFAKDGKALTYKCTICNTVGTVVASPFDPATRGHQVVQLAANEYIYFDYTPGKAGTTTGVNSAKTFDAGIAMYVGMSLLSVAGGAVVIGKKKEF